MSRIAVRWTYGSLGAHTVHFAMLLQGAVDGSGWSARRSWQPRRIDRPIAKGGCKRAFLGGFEGPAALGNPPSDQLVFGTYL